MLVLFMAQYYPKTGAVVALISAWLIAPWRTAFAAHCSVFRRMALAHRAPSA